MAQKISRSKILPLKIPTTQNKNVLKDDFKLDRNATMRVNKEDLFIDFSDLEEVRQLGSGEFGSVCEMLHKPSRIRFAVKKIYPENRDDIYKAAVTDLKVSISIRDSCPYLISFFGALYCDAHLWIITELMDCSLDIFFRKSREIKLKIPEYFMAYIAHSTLNGLIYLRQKNIIHRDVKPSNILIRSGDSCFKLCDFGICGFSKNSICNSFAGFGQYMAPEKIKITTGYTIKSDIWSLAISLIEMSEGAHPYSKIKSFIELSTTILDGAPPKLNPDLFSENYCIFIDKCLIKNYQQRPTCMDMLKEPFITQNVQASNETYFKTITTLVIQKIKQT